MSCCYWISKFFGMRSTPVEPFIKDEDDEENETLPIHIKVSRVSKKIIVTPCTTPDCNEELHNTLNCNAERYDTPVETTHLFQPYCGSIGQSPFTRKHIDYGLDCIDFPSGLSPLEGKAQNALDGGSTEVLKYLAVKKHNI